MLTTITAAPSNIVHPGARIASKPAAKSHAHANANVAITGRASCDTRGLATAAASASKITTSADTLSRPIQEVIVSGASSERSPPRALIWTRAADGVPH
jgi:hypothetical protein